MKAITVTDLSKSYDETDVLSGLSFSVESGAIFGLLGPNGAGKTTTIDILTGVSLADSGHANVLGLNPAIEPILVREQVGILPEKESPFSFLTVREYFEFVGDVRGLDSETVEQRVTDWAGRLAFAEKMDVLCKDLSRGQQQKVMLVQSVLAEPEVLFIDEPLANLDPVMQERVKEFIREYNEAGNTIVLCTHNVEVAEELCTNIGILNDGSFVREFAPSELAEGETVRETYLEEMGEA
jgi:ABC-2 type transport system ATP-binding protein